ncbi:MAG: hypothetical protein KIS92_15130 [Planctomycetota bacterium]|nr:hypothetical protein [Planctomycetota bacterium]
MALAARHALPGAAQAWKHLCANYAERGRAYHNLAHVAACLAHLDAFARRVRVPVGAFDDLELALWFHDFVYDPKRKDNEARSAAAFARGVGKALPAARRRRIVQWILATRHTQPPADPGEHLIVDLDLAILGAPRTIFDAYERAVRKEYAFVPEEAFRAGRAAVLKHFLARPRIFGTAYFFAKLEKVARRNLRRSLTALTRK